MLLPVGNCTYSSWSIRESQTKVVYFSCTILGLVVELHSLLIFLLIENKQKTLKMYSKIFFKWKLIYCQWFVNLKENSGRVNKLDRIKSETAQAGSCLMQNLTG